MDYSPIVIARNLRRGMTRTNLAKEIGASPQALYMWEQGLRTPGATTAAKISEALDVDEAWIRGTAQSAPLYDPLGGMTYTCPIVRSEKLPGDAGMLYHVYMTETGNVVALLLHHGVQFTPTDWETRDNQPGSAAEIADYRWMDARGADAIMLDGLPHMFPV